MVALLCLQGSFQALTVALTATEHPPAKECCLSFLPLHPVCLKLLIMLSVGVAVLFTLLYIPFEKKRKTWNISHQNHDYENMKPFI